MCNIGLCPRVQRNRNMVPYLEKIKRSYYKLSPIKKEMLMNCIIRNYNARFFELFIFHAGGGRYVHCPVELQIAIDNDKKEIIALILNKYIMHEYCSPMLKNSIASTK